MMISDTLLFSGKHRFPANSPRCNEHISHS
jgi:hypothetical protein